MSFQQNVAQFFQQLTTQGHDLSFTHPGGMVTHGYCIRCGAAFTVVKLGQQYKVMGISTAHPCIHSAYLDSHKVPAEPVALPAS